MSNEAKISVIIPMHNAGEFLRPCIDSLINQTFKDFEILCIDDGSEDETVSIIEEFKQRDARIKLIKQEKSNAGAARNTGIKSAKGEYVMFLDADDFFETELLKLTYKKARATDADVVLFDGRTYDTMTDEYKEVNHYLRKNMLPDTEPFNRRDFPDTDLLYVSNPAPWTKLFKMAFIEENNLQFQSLPNTNDAYFILAALSKADKISTVQERLINYRINRKGSIQNGKKDAPCCFIEAYEALYKRLIEWGIYEEVKKGFICNFLSSAVFLLNSFRDNNIKKQIAYSLKNSMLKATDALDYPIEYYKNQDAYYMIKSVLKGIEWSEKRAEKTQEKINIIGEADKGKKVKISVIIPVYDVEEYLKECLDSVLNQTLKDIEIICVNDGSKDNSLNILKQYADLDKRIIIVDKTNGGLSSARNAGIDIANGEYLYYLDSDDYLELDALQLLYDKCVKDDLDIVFFDAESFFSGSRENFSNNLINYVKKHDYSHVVSGIEYMTETEKNNEYRQSACLQLIKKKFLDENGFRFYEGILHEDNLYTFKVLLKAKRVSNLPKVLYHRRLHEGSIMTTLSFNHSYGYFVSYYEMVRLMDGISGLDDKQNVLICDILYRVMSAARSKYYKINEEEKYFYIFLNPIEYYRFYADVYMVVNTKVKNEELQQKLQAANRIRVLRKEKIILLREKLEKERKKVAKLRKKLEKSEATKEKNEETEIAVSQKKKFGLFRSHK